MSSLLISASVAATFSLHGMGVGQEWEEGLVFLVVLSLASEFEAYRGSALSTPG